MAVSPTRKRPSADADQEHHELVRQRCRASIIKYHVAFWRAPPSAPWLSKALNQTSQRQYDNAAGCVAIPFMSMLVLQYPQAQFVITGVLGPHSNAHGPNEFLHLDYAQRLRCCVAEIIAAAG